MKEFDINAKNKVSQNTSVEKFRFENSLYSVDAGTEDFTSVYSEKWTFSSTGELASQTPENLPGSTKTEDDYFVVLKDKTSLTDDMLILSFEGNSLNTSLPEVRFGKEITLTFMILDRLVILD